MCNGWSIVANYQFHVGGRIWLHWRPSIIVANVCDYGAQFIHCEVLHKATGKQFAVTFIYGFNDPGDREE